MSNPELGKLNPEERPENQEQRDRAITDPAELALFKLELKRQRLEKLAAREGEAQNPRLVDALEYYDKLIALNEAMMNAENDGDKAEILVDIQMLIKDNLKVIQETDSFLEETRKEDFEEILNNLEESENLEQDIREFCTIHGFDDNNLPLAEATSLWQQTRDKDLIWPFVAVAFAKANESESPELDIFLRAQEVKEVRDRLRA